MSGPSIPTLLRSCTSTDPDWAADQSEPPAEILVDLRGTAKRVAVSVVILDGSDAPISGTVDVQPLEWFSGARGGPHVEVGAPDTLTNGLGARYEVEGVHLFTVRLAAIAAPGAARIDIRWRVVA